MYTIQPKPIQLGEITFPSKSSAKQFVKDILHNRGDISTAVYGIDDYLNDSDFAFIKTVFDNHYHVIENNLTIERIQIGQDMYKKRNFILHFADGSSDTLSFHKAIDGKPTEDKYLLEAFRRSINDQIYEFKRKNFKDEMKCPLTGESLTFNTVHVDHQYPKTFDAILAEFLTLLDDGETDVLLNFTIVLDSDGMRTLEHNAYCEAWQQYHRENAVLRFLSPRGNLSVTKRRLI